MKALISVKTLEQACANGERQCRVTPDTIVTPAARDWAQEHGLELLPASTTDASKAEAGAALTKDALFALLKQLLADGDADAPFKACVHANGLKLVHGDSVKLDVFDTGEPKANAHYQELVNKDESQMSGGILEIERSQFDWHLTYEEIDYVISGTLEVTIDGKKYTAKAGDVMYIPADSHVTFGSPDHVRVFATAYPSNWADAL